MIVFWIVVFVMLFSAAGWVGFKMGQQVVVHEIRHLESMLRSPLAPCYGFSAEERVYYQGAGSANESVADMLNELCNRIDP